MQSHPIDKESNYLGPMCSYLDVQKHSLRHLSCGKTGIGSESPYNFTLWRHKVCKFVRHKSYTQKPVLEVDILKAKSSTIELHIYLIFSFGAFTDSSFRLCPKSRCLEFPEVLPWWTDQTFEI